MQARPNQVKNLRKSGGCSPRFAGQIVCACATTEANIAAAADKLEIEAVIGDAHASPNIARILRR